MRSAIVDFVAGTPNPAVAAPNTSRLDTKGGQRCIGRRNLEVHDALEKLARVDARFGEMRYGLPVWATRDRGIIGVSAPLARLGRTTAAKRCSNRASGCRHCCARYDFRIVASADVCRQHGGTQHRLRLALQRLPLPYFLLSRCARRLNKAPLHATDFQDSWAPNCQGVYSRASTGRLTSIATRAPASTHVWGVCCGPRRGHQRAAAFGGRARSSVAAVQRNQGAWRCGLSKATPRSGNFDRRCGQNVALRRELIRPSACIAAVLRACASVCGGKPSALRTTSSAIASASAARPVSARSSACRSF